MIVETYEKDQKQPSFYFNKPLYKKFFLWVSLSCFAVVPWGICGNVWYIQTDYSIHSKLRIFAWFWSHSWKYNIQANESLTKVKEKWSTIQVDLFYLSFIFFIPMFQTISVSGKCAGVCACDRTHQMEKTVYGVTVNLPECFEGLGDIFQ